MKIIERIALRLRLARSLTCKSYSDGGLFAVAFPDLFGLGAALAACVFFFPEIHSALLAAKVPASSLALGAVPAPAVAAAAASAALDPAALRAIEAAFAQIAGLLGPLVYAVSMVLFMRGLWGFHRLSKGYYQTRAGSSAAFCLAGAALAAATFAATPSANIEAFAAAASAPLFESPLDSTVAIAFRWIGGGACALFASLFVWGRSCGLGPRLNPEAARQEHGALLAELECDELLGSVRKPEAASVRKSL